MESKLNGLLVTYRDDQIDESVRLALKGKLRVRYRCMDTFAHFIAFGTSSGTTYLYRLDVVTHSTCSQMSMIACDQGSIEVIKFLPSQQSNDILIVIGTSRGSIVIFRLFQSPREENALFEEIYKAERFTNNSSIKLIESDQYLLDPECPFSRLYICDSADRLYVLESTTRNGIRRFPQSHLPSLIFSVNDSRINQISVYGSRLLISTDETTRLFVEHSNQLNVIGKKKRKVGYYGACFLNPYYKPSPITRESRSTSYSSMATSMNNLESLLIFVARPVFRMWQVNLKCEVMFTHQFEQLIKTSRFFRPVELETIPLEDNTIDDPTEVMKSFTSDIEPSLKSENFHKLIPIYSSTLGNLLLSYSQHELFIIDPIEAELVTWCPLKETIIQVCCNESEIFIWCQAIENEQRQFHLKRLVLLAPTQFVLELHRIHRYLTLVMFVQQFSDLFRDRMALPLNGPNIITTEGGLLRNILLNAWDVVNQWRNHENQLEWLSDLDTLCAEYKKLVEEIVEESNQLKSSLDNLTDSRFFLAMANENIDRLLSEPYASLVSLEVSIAELHTNHVIHFSREAINRHKSVVNLSNDIRSAVHEARNRTRSNMDLSNLDPNSNMPSKSMRDLTNTSFRAKKAQVIVERQRPKRNSIRFGPSRFEKVPEDGTEEQTIEADSDVATYFSVKTAQENLGSISELTDGNAESDTNAHEESNNDEQDEAESERRLELSRCKNCRWPKAGSHLEPLNASQSIQLEWIEENLTTNFFENIDLIEERAFRHSLWNMFLKCLAFKRQIDDYIICCMLLDDVRLLDIEQLVIICSGEDEMMDLLLTHLNRKMDLDEKNVSSLESNTTPKKRSPSFCLKCEKEYQLEESINNEVLDIAESCIVHDEDGFDFTLANLFNQFIKRNNSNIKKMVGHLLNYPKLLNKSSIPISLYLKAIENTINRSRRIKIWYSTSSNTKLTS